MRHVEDEQIVKQARLILSVVPPSEALALARRFTPLLGKPGHSAMFVDCNAIRVSTIEEIGRA
jgi:putative dehydrogenase